MAARTLFTQFAVLLSCLVPVVVQASDFVIVAFTSTQCEPCRQLSPSLQQLKSEGWGIREVDVGRYPALVQQYKIQSLPTLVMIFQGREIDRLVGVPSIAQMRERFQRVAVRDRSPALPQQNVAGARAASQSLAPVSHSRQPNPTPGPVVRGQSVGISSQIAGGMPMASMVSAASQSPARTAPTQAAPLTPEQAIQRAQRATVRIRVDEERQDPSGNIQLTTAFGTGTIVDVHGQEALVLTCGHLFRDMQAGSDLTVELFAGTPQETKAVAQLIDFRADDVDIGLISFRMPVSIEPVAVLPQTEAVSVNQRVFTFGCSHGDDPTRFDTRISQIDRYLGSANIEIQGAPAVGRSGGGMFDLQGRLVGVCNAANANEDEGIYAATSLVHEQLNRLGLSHLISGSTQLPTQMQPAAAPAANTGDIAATVAPAVGSGWDSPGADAAGPGLNAIQPLPQADGVRSPAAVQITCIMRDEAGNSRVVTIDAPSPALLQTIQAHASER